MSHTTDTKTIKTYYPAPTVLETLRHYGEFAHGGDPQGAADDWGNAGFSDLQSGVVAEWLEARCFDADTANEFARAGVSPDDASRKCSDLGLSPLGDKGETIGYAVSNGDLSVAEVVAALAAERDGCAQ